MPDNLSDETVVDDTVEAAVDENQEFDTLDDAAEALVDSEPTDEQPEDDEGDSDTKDEKSSDDADETDASKDFEDGDVLVTLDNGEQVELDELKSGYFRDKDYRHKTEQLAEQRNEVDSLRETYSQDAQQIQTAYHNLTRVLESLIPPAPPIGLASSDPAEYQIQQVYHEQAKAELQNIFANQQEFEGTVEGMGEQEVSRLKTAEEAKLFEAMPNLKEPGQRAAFDAANKKTALEYGFTEQEIEQTYDSRILRLVHDARLGRIAKQNRKNATQRVAEKPHKGKRANPVTNKPSKNAEAMKRLQNDGSVESAIAALSG